MSASHTDPYLLMGKWGRPQGIHGWIRLLSFSHPIDNILDYQPWYQWNETVWKRWDVEEAKIHGNTLVAKLKGFDSPETVRQFTGQALYVNKAVLPALPDNEYYWHELIGLKVYNLDGLCLGEVSELINMGAHDILVIQDIRLKHLVPYVLPTFVKSINQIEQTILVDWTPID